MKSFLSSIFLLIFFCSCNGKDPDLSSINGAVGDRPLAFSGIEYIADIRTTSLSLHWNPFPEAVGYDIFFSQNDGGIVYHSTVYGQAVNSAALADLVSNTDYRFIVRAKYANGANDSNSHSLMVRTLLMEDTTNPTVTITKSLNQGIKTFSLPIKFDITFSEPINTYSFTVEDLSLVANSGTWSLSRVDDQHFTLSILSAGDGLVMPGIAGGLIADKAGNLNLASTSVEFVDYFKPSASQALSPLNYHFGSVALETESEWQTFSIINQGASNFISCSAPEFIGLNASDFKIRASTCHSTVPVPGGTCEMIVYAKPTFVGLSKASLIRRCDGGSVATLVDGLTVNGIVGFSWDYSSLDLGKVLLGKSSGTKTFVFKNISGVTASSCTVPVLSNPTDFSFLPMVDATDCRQSTLQTMGTNASCTIKVQTNSTATAGSKTTQLSRTCSGIDTSLFLGAQIITGAPVELALGGTHTCLLKSDKTVDCWGGNKYGQVGQPGTQDEYLPKEVAISDVTKISSGEFHTCAVVSGTSVKCWGSNSNGQLGNGTQLNSSTPVSVQDLLPGGLFIVQITAAKNSTCVLYSDGRMSCWGSNQNSIFGTGASIYTKAVELTRNEFRSFAMTETSICALKADRPGTIQCWGNSADGLAIGGGSDVNLPGTVLQLTSNKDTFCAMFINGTLNCWGRNSYQSSGTSSGIVLTTPTAVLSPNTGLFESLSMSQSQSYHFCGTYRATSDNKSRVRCWGLDNYSQVEGSAAGVQSIKSVPFDVTGLEDVTSVAVGQYHSCAILNNMSVKCWGSNVNGQFGAGSFMPQIGIQTLTANIKQVAISDSTNCVVSTAKRATCWGRNHVGQIGAEVGNTIDTLVNDYPYLLVEEIAFGGADTEQSVCARLTSEVQCWGSNNFGKLGRGTVSTMEGAPAVSAGFAGALSISGGKQNMCATFTAGVIKCAGSNAFGQVGNASAISSSPFTNPTALAADSLSVGDSFLCSYNLNSSALVQCWGRNASGQLGDGTVLTTDTARGISGLGTITRVVDLENGGCALTNKLVKCWGEGSSGQLGNGKFTSSQVPVTVNALYDVTDIASGANHVCALASGVVKCWGDNKKGQLGLSNLTNQGTPVTVMGLPAMLSLWKNSDGDTNHSCGISEANKLYCWGRREVFHPLNKPLPKTSVSGYGD